MSSVRDNEYPLCDRNEAIRLSRLAASISESAGDNFFEQCKPIRQLYEFLGIIDNKANALVGLNGLIVAILGLIVFSPLEDMRFTTAVTPQTMVNAAALIGASIAVVMSFVNIYLGLHIFQIRWKFMEDVTDSPVLAQFTSELRRLALETARRQRLIRDLREKTTRVCLWSGLVILLSWLRHVV